MSGFFRTEAELCETFLALLPKGWVAYPETCGWDILLSRAADGRQIGIQAKLRLNARVLTQAAETPHPLSGPDYRAVLVPEGGSRELDALASYCALTVVRVRGARPEDREYDRGSFHPFLPWGENDSPWHDLVPESRHRLPEYVPEVPAGVPAPTRLTRWTIGALRLCAILDAGGVLTRNDFKRYGIDIRRWIGGRDPWLAAADGGFVATAAMPDFSAKHPTTWMQIKADLMTAACRRDAA